MFRIQLVSSLLVLSLSLAACAVTITPPPPTTVPAAEVAIPAAAQPAVDAAIQIMAAERGVDAATIRVVNVEAVEWSDSCLGIVRADMMCAQVITPGYRITLAAEGAEYDYHSDATGSHIMAADSGLVDASLEIAEMARQALIRELQVADDQVTVVSIEPMQWSNSCLGVTQPDVMCAEVITPGYRIVLTANDTQYIYHTDATGENIVAADSGLVDASVEIAEMARQALIRELQVADDQVTVVSIEPMQWSNSCLGVTQPDVMCAEVITPGYRIVFTANDTQYIYHTDATGENIVAAQP